MISGVELAASASNSREIDIYVALRDGTYVYDPLDCSSVRSQSHPYYQAVNKVLAEKGFDRFAEKTCAKFYAKKMGRPSMAPGVYFRCLLLGYFEGIDSERGIAWRAADSLSLRDFLGIPASKLTPDHSTISRSTGSWRSCSTPMPSYGGAKTPRNCHPPPAMP